ncbi:SDR family oxidoreductase [Streptomyces sp. NBC_00289]|uniref:SDR family NAD(P)-dependent oxidoreductase n=1 Tax=Streptomyces sp. NBC_00289 TaxID=2975703 RepID=UPI0032537815
MQRLAGKVALVTGGAHGIGAACSKRLAAEGAAVVLSDLVDPSEVVRDIAANGGRAVAVIADVADEHAWQDAVALAHRRFGEVDILVSNAYASEVRPAHETSRASWDQQLAVCLTGTFLGVRACLPDLNRKHGAVVIISSVHALFGIPGHAAYAAAKGGLVALGRQLAVEYGPGVRINSILPGPILTAAWSEVSEEDMRQTGQATIAGRLGNPDEVAAAAAFLVSDEASFITGTTLVVDGGWSASKASR